MKKESNEGQQGHAYGMDRASNFICAHSLPFKVSESVASNLSVLFLTLEVPHEIRRDVGGIVRPRGDQAPASMLTAPIRYGAVNHPRGQGTAERTGGWLKEVLPELCKAWPDRLDDYVEANVGSSALLLTPCCRLHSCLSRPCLVASEEHSSRHLHLRLTEK